MTNHKVSHLYQPEIIVPYSAIENNWEVRVYRNADLQNIVMGAAQTMVSSRYATKLHLLFKINITQKCLTLF